MCYSNSLIIFRRKSLETIMANKIIKIAKGNEREVRNFLAIINLHNLTDKNMETLFLSLQFSHFNIDRFTTSCIECKKIIFTHIERAEISHN